MADKKLDIDQLRGTDFSNRMLEIVNGSSLTMGLVTSIAAGDDSKEVIQTCTSKLHDCSDKLVKAVTQIDDYMNKMAQAFEDMDKELSEKLDVTVSDASLSPLANAGSKRANRYSGKLNRPSSKFGEKVLN